MNHTNSDPSYIHEDRTTCSLSPTSNQLTISNGSASEGKENNSQTCANDANIDSACSTVSNKVKRESSIVAVLKVEQDSNNDTHSSTNVVENDTSDCVDNVRCCEPPIENAKQDTLSSHECSIVENSRCKIALLGLNRNALDPVVSVEKLEPSGIFCEHFKQSLPTNNCTHKAEDPEGNLVGTSVDIDKTDTEALQELDTESPANDITRSDSASCDKVAEESDIAECGINDISKSNSNEDNNETLCRKVANESPAASKPCLTENPESAEHCNSSATGNENKSHHERDELSSSHLHAETTVANVCASDIIPEDEATKICDALLQTLSPLEVDHEPEEKFLVSIKLEKLNKRVQPMRASRSSTRKISYASRPNTRLTRRSKEAWTTESKKSVAMEDSSPDEEETKQKDDCCEEECNTDMSKGSCNEAGSKERVLKKSSSRKRSCSNENLKDKESQSTTVVNRGKAAAEIRPASRGFHHKRSRNEETHESDTSDCNYDDGVRNEDQENDHSCESISVKTEEDGRYDEKICRKKLKKCRLLPKRTTRHSRPIQEEDIPDELIVSINLDNIDSYCQDDEKPACSLSTHTYSEGWMVQEEVSKSEKNKQFCVDDIFVDKKAFGVIKYRAVCENGEVKERVEILESKVAPANYIWPKDEDVRDTERLLVQSVANEEVKRIAGTIGPCDDSRVEVIDKPILACASDVPKEEADINADSSGKSDVDIGPQSDSKYQEDQESHSCDSSTKIPVSEGVAKDDPVPSNCQLEETAVKCSNSKRKYKSMKTRLKGSDNTSQSQAALRKTRSQTARGSGGNSNSDVISHNTSESKDSAEPAEGVENSVKVAKLHEVVVSEQTGNLGSGLMSTDIAEAEKCCSTPPGVNKTCNEAVSSFSQSIAEKDAPISDGEVAAGRIEQEEKAGLSEKATQLTSNEKDVHKSLRVKSKRRKGSDLMTSRPARYRKMLRQQRGKSQLEPEPDDLLTERSVEVSKDVKDDAEIEHVKNKEVEKIAKDGELIDAEEPASNEGRDISVTEGGEIKEPMTSDNEKSTGSLCVDKLKSQEETISIAADTRNDFENSRDPGLAESVGKNCIDGKSDLDMVNGKTEEENGCEVKANSKEPSVSFTPDHHDSCKSDSDSLQGSPARFQEDFSEMHPSSVATSIMSSIATSLNNDLFVMNGCDLEFTLPGMSKDVLVKASGNVVKSNDIEDCLRLPPADDKSELHDLPQTNGLACPDEVLRSEIGHRQSLLSSDMDCLSPKFFNLTPEEGTNGGFVNGPQRINREFQRGDTFLNGGNTESPFQPAEEDIDLKAGDSRTADKWDGVLLREPEMLMNKSQITELVDDPFMNSNELRTGSIPEDSLLTQVETFTENDIANSPCDDDTFGIPDSQFENVDIPTEEFECGQGLAEDPTESMEYAKQSSEGYSSGSSTDDDDDDEDSDSSETDSDSSSSSSSRSDDEDEDDDDDDDEEEDSEEEESESSDSESDINDEVKRSEVYLDDGTKVGILTPSPEIGREPFSNVPIEEVVFQDSEILPIERKECREFFMGKLSKSPEKYLEIRRFIICEWNKIRPAYLTKNSIRSKVDPTDANAIGRVFMFLENIGAINVGCSVKNKWVERMERRRVKYFSAKQIESTDGSVDEQKQRRGGPPSFLKESEKREVFLDFSIITDEEKSAHPQFFNGNKNKSPEKYLKMRNSIINCWMDSKPAYLTKQEARLAMSWYCGDANAISRVHDYLEQIGAINFGCAQESKKGRRGRGHVGQERTRPGAKSKEFEIEQEAKAAMVDSKAMRMKNAQKKLKDITREVELEIGKPMNDCDISPYDIYSERIHVPNELKSRISDDIDLAKPKLKRGRKPKIRQCEPDSTVHDENLMTEKDLVRPPKNGLIPGKEIWESGPASDKSSVGDSGFDSVSEISPLLESETLILKPSLAQDVNMPSIEDENDDASYPLPTEEKRIDASMITEEEKIGCPEFFVGSRVKPPEKYVKIRDSILRSWHSKRPFYLNKLNARRDMPSYTGDINSIGRVHAFLERIGAINYQAIHKPKRPSRVAICSRRKRTDSPRYDAPSPETEEEDEISGKLAENDICSEDLIIREERDSFKQLLSEGNCVDGLSSRRSTVRDVISDMWVNCKRKYVSKPSNDHRFANDYVDDGEDDDDVDNDSSSDIVDDTYIDNRTLINGTYSETGKNGVWDMTKTFSLGLRPRKRWKMDINQDWIDRTESEGFTIKVCFFKINSTHLIHSS